MNNLKNIIREMLGYSLSSITREIESKTEYKIFIIKNTINKMIESGELIQVRGGLHSVKDIQAEVLYLIGNQVMNKRNLITIVSTDLRVRCGKINRTYAKILINGMIKEELLVSTYGDVNAFEMYKLNTKYHTLPEYRNSDV